MPENIHFPVCSEKRRPKIEVSSATSGRPKTVAGIDEEACASPHAKRLRKPRLEGGATPYAAVTARRRRSFQVHQRRPQPMPFTLPYEGGAGMQARPQVQVARSHVFFLDGTSAALRAATSSRSFPLRRTVSTASSQRFQLPAQRSPTETFIRLMVRPFAS